MSNKKDDNIPLWLVLAFFTAILLFFFLINEDFDCSKKINHEKFNAFFTSLGAIVTATSLFLLYRQTKMLQEERKLAVQPDLFPATGRFYSREFYSQQFKHLSLSFKTSESETTEYDPDGCYVIITNIGLGVAKKVTAELKYDIDKSKELLNKIYQFHAESFTNYLKRNDDFLKVNEQIKIYIPAGYMALHGQKMQQVENKPSLTLKITYLNSYNDKEVKEFKAVVTYKSTYIRIAFDLITT